MSRRTDTTDIREWLRENRPDLNVQPKGKIAAAAINVYRDAHAEDDPQTGEIVETAAGSPQFPDTQAEVPPEQAGEAAKGWFRRKVAPKAKPRQVQRRVPLDSLLSMGWSGLAYIFKNPQTMPVGRVLELQAPAAGMVLDDALKGSLVDKVLQPVARTSKRGEAVWAVAGPPMLVGAICQRPELYPVLRPMLRESLKSWVLMAGPKMRKAAEREKKLMEELGTEADASIDAMIEALFAPVEGMEEAGAAEDYAGAAA